MAQLFKKNIVKEKIQSYEIPNLEEKIKVLKNWCNLHNNWTLKAKKEEELEWPFWADFFGKILDYNSITEDEIYNRRFQPKVPEWWQKADIGLWFFGEEKEIMKVVVELKDAKTSLDKPQQRAWNLTPVQQAFKYKPYFKDCDFNIYYKLHYTDKNVKPIYLKELPIKNIPLSEQKPFIEKANFMLDKNKEIQEKVNKFIKRLNSSFEIDKLSKKLEAFYDLEFSEFVKGLKKKKIELSLKDQDEWEEYFDSYKKEILDLKSEIDICDKEIDEMVFDLYGLSEDERNIVLESN